MKLRNASNDTVRDFLTQQVAEPDQVIEVDDVLAIHYENHTVWDVVEGPEGGFDAYHDHDADDNADADDEKEES